MLKVSRRDLLPSLLRKKLTGATTVATTVLAGMAGIHVFATGSIGGVHRHGEVTMDVSADLRAGAYAGCGYLRGREDDSGYRAHA